MEKQTYQEINLSLIKSNPQNPRRNFSGIRFDELVKSIREKGVLEPILLRPTKKGFEVVAGERRFRAQCKVAKENGGIEKFTIPAIVKELNDSEAFDIMIIENLQREDLTELEEAQAFKEYLDKRGDDGLTCLAERTGINPCYIRRRVAVLDLPIKLLKEWEKGRLKYGHLEQFSRLIDHKAILQMHKIASERSWDDGFMSVKELRALIDDGAIALKDALFSILKLNREINEWFGVAHKIKDSFGELHDEITGCSHYESDDFFVKIEKMPPDAVLSNLKEAVLRSTMEEDYNMNFGPDARHLIAKFIGIDLKEEWRITKEYLDKKTISEIMSIGETFKIFKDKKAIEYLANTLKRKSFSSCKKSELINVFLESGIDLSGKVPEEILKIS